MNPAHHSMFCKQGRQSYWPRMTCAIWSGRPAGTLSTDVCFVFLGCDGLFPTDMNVSLHTFFGFKSCTPQLLTYVSLPVSCISFLCLYLSCLTHFSCTLLFHVSLSNSQISLSPLKSLDDQIKSYEHFQKIIWAFLLFYLIAFSNSFWAFQLPFSTSR